jgi:ABC-2 type transport system permease protein
MKAGRMSNTLAITARIYRQLLGDRRFLALALSVPLIVIYLFKVFIQTLPISLFTDPEQLDILITAFIVHFTSYVLCLIVIVRERREQTLERMFVNNYGRSDIVLGYLLGYAGLATLQAVLIMIEVNYFFKLTYGLDLMFSIFAVIWTLSMISIAVGIMVSNLARTEAQIFPFIPLFILPTIFCSGLLIPITSLPWSIRWISYLIPLTYALKVLKPMIEELVGLQAYLAQFGVLIIYGVLLLSASSLTLRQRE